MPCVLSELSDTYFKNNTVPCVLSELSDTYFKNNTVPCVLSELSDTYFNNNTVPCVLSELSDTYFKNNTVPCVLSELSVDAKYTALADGIYNYFVGVYGTRKMQHKHRTRRKKLASRVKEEKSLKNAARCELNRVRKEPSISQEQINSIAHKFFKSVGSHNKLTR